jgi:hypothetical protein
VIKFYGFEILVVVVTVGAGAAAVLTVVVVVPGLTGARGVIAGALFSDVLIAA